MEPVKKRELRKKVFETTWSENNIYLMNSVSLAQEGTFPIKRRDGKSHPIRGVITPDHISFGDLVPFLAKRTRITIEELE